ncbi:YicC/YloC family endoribonuclease [Comamonas antarctica]|nr:YicC/YloC family endoribonuclease [Comamonas antarctica]
MTGYASAQYGATAEGAEAPAGNRRLGLEIRSVNSRFLDLSFRLPDELRAHEPALRTLLTSRLKRGKVEVRAAIESEDGGALPQPSPQQLQRLVSAQDTIQAWLPNARPLSVSDALRLCSTGDGDRAQDWGSVLPALAGQALEAMVQARAREGERLADMLHDRLQQLRALAQTATPLIPQLVEQQRQRFVERWKEAMALAEGAVAPEAAQDRALTEATAFAIRIDVAEEVTRLDSHLVEIERLLKKGGEIGKRLDFLIQELHREANTLGSKSAALELTRISVDMKVLIEQMREQVQNIE